MGTPRGPLLMDERRQRPNTPPEYDEEVSLAEYLRVLWQYRLILAAVAILAVVATVLVDWNRTPIYQASSRLMVSASKIGDTAVPVSMGTYQAMVSSQGLVTATLDELGLSKPPHAMTAAEVIGGALTVQAIPDTTVLQVTARMPDPQLAAEFANRLAAKAVEVARNASRADTETARDTIKSQLDESRNRLDSAEKKLEEFQRSAGIDALQADVTALMDERGRLLSLQVEIESERARVRQITEELSRQEPVRSVRSALVGGRSMGEPARQPREPDRPSREPDRPSREPEKTAAPPVPPKPPETSPPSPKPATPSRDAERGSPAAAPLSLREDAVNPYVNPVYEVLQQQLATSRSNLMALEQERAAIARATNSGGGASVKVQELYGRKAELDRLETERDLARRVYLDVSNRYEQARIQVASRSAQMHVIDTAVPSAVPISPRPFRDAVAALAGSLILTSAAILLLTALSGAARRRPPINAA